MVRIKNHVWLKILIFRLQNLYTERSLTTKVDCLNWFCLFGWKMYTFVHASWCKYIIIRLVKRSSYGDELVDGDRSDTFKGELHPDQKIACYIKTVYTLCKIMYTYESIFLTCHIISFQNLFQYYTSKQKHKRHMILRTWSKGPKGLKQSCRNKDFKKYTETCKHTLCTQTEKNTQEHNRHAPKWNQLYSDGKTDFSWYRKCLVVLQCFTVLSREF